MKTHLSLDEMNTMREAGKVVSAFFRSLKNKIAPGLTTKDIEKEFDSFLLGFEGMEPAFKGYMGYPASVCASVNEEVIHGIPSDKKIIKQGDLVSIDLGIKYRGLFVDSAYTYMIGKVSDEAKKLSEVTLASLNEAIKHVKIGACVGDIGCAVQRFVEKNGFAVIRSFVGHGIGNNLHQPPEVPNFGKEGQGPVLEEGQVIAIEPMVVAGTYKVKVLSDGWTVVTADNALSAHFEHTVAVTKKGAWIITE
ncbi:MAG: type I methionyl aminopeptidase [Candidatus Omnitrophica bacterium]|nr:type I methionyl aminopeptidase [Candidatus Omnitrophota bacterium]